MTKPLAQYLTKQTLGRVCAYLQSMADEGNYKLTFKPVSQRTLEQNAKLQAMCTDISNQVGLDTVNGGYKLIADCDYYRQFSHNSWRHIMIAGFTNSEVVPGVEPGQAVCLYPSTTDLGLSKGAEFIEYLYAYGAEKGVVWTEPDDERAA